MPSQKVILVDNRNRKTGVEEKIKAHEEGKLHRTFSIFVFNKMGELLLQQRAKTKYHSAGLWTNTVCSHPKLGETYYQATNRRLKEEMGFDCALKKKFCFIYKTKFGNGLTEHEYDCIFTGEFDGIPKPEPEEVVGYRWISPKELNEDIKKTPEKYTVWLKIALEKLMKEKKIKNERKNDAYRIYAVKSSNPVSRTTKAASASGMFGLSTKRATLLPFLPLRK